MTNEPNQEAAPLLPDLNQPKFQGVGLFFAVVDTAIKNVDWKRADFEKVQYVEGQLKALKDFFAYREAPDPSQTVLQDFVSVAEPGQGDAIAPNPVQVPTQEIKPHQEAPVASQSELANDTEKKK